MGNDKKIKPKISFITPMKEQDFRVIRLLKSIRLQNYPQHKIEIIITDGGSNPEVLKEAKKYRVKIFNNSKMLAEGAGMGKDQGIWKSTGDFIVIAESDLELIGKNWINNMIRPFIEHKEIFASVPRLFINKQDNFTNKYLSYVGVDPFAVYRSLEGNLVLKKLNKVQCNGYSLLKMDKIKPYCMGSNGFMFKKSLIKDVGDYAQDVEFIARIANKGYHQFAVVENARVWHKNVQGFVNFLKKRVKWTRNYSKIYINEKKDFNWIHNKILFFLYVLTNLLVLPNFFISLKKIIEYKDFSWILHAPLMFISTFLNIYFTLTSRKMFQQLF